MAKIICSKCKVGKFANPKIYEARIQKYGSLEEAEKQWVCSECKGLPKKERKVKSNEIFE